MFSLGISGNDFWWHLKAGEWMVVNKALPSIDIFSWYAKENGIHWISHEWLSQVFFYCIHNATGDLGIFFFSLISAIGMALLIMIRNKDAIKKSIVLSSIFLFPMVILIKLMFYGRPHLISFFLLYATLSCLYSYRRDETSRAIYLIPFISVLWGNFHGGSSTLSYILCFMFMFSGLFEFSIGKLHGEKLSRKQLLTYFGVGVLSIAALAINPYGLHMLTYPYVNMGDSFAQGMINEWTAPDAKEISHLIVFYLPLFIIGVSMIITDKRIKAVDLLVFTFFLYMFFRSVRFAVVFQIASAFFAFDYFIAREIKAVRTKLDSAIFCVFLLILIGVNVVSFSNIVKAYHAEKLISVVLETKFIELVKKDVPQRLYNDYNFGVTLILNGIETFVDARADLFSPHNLRDAKSLLSLTQFDKKEKSKIFDPEKIIEKYNFDAFLISSSSPLSVYLRSKPDNYKILLEDEEAVYFKRIDVLN